MSSEMSKIEKLYERKPRNMPEPEKVSIKEELKKDLDTRNELIRKTLGEEKCDMISKLPLDPGDTRTEKEAIPERLWTSFGVEMQIRCIKGKEIKWDPEIKALAIEDLKRRIEEMGKPPAKEKVPDKELSKLLISDFEKAFPHVEKAEKVKEIEK